MIVSVRKRRQQTVVCFDDVNSKTPVG